MTSMKKMKKSRTRRRTGSAEGERAGGLGRKGAKRKVIDSRLRFSLSFSLSICSPSSSSLAISLLLLFIAVCSAFHGRPSSSRAAHISNVQARRIWCRVWSLMRRPPTLIRRSVARPRRPPNTSESSSRALSLWRRVSISNLHPLRARSSSLAHIHPSRCETRGSRDAVISCHRDYIAREQEAARR